MAGAGKPAHLTFGEGLKDFGFFSMLFAVAVSGPSVLSLLQAVFVEHRLVDALQWIVDGYDNIAGVLGAIAEPLIRPMIAWFNEQFGWSLVLQPHWRPLFVLAMVLVIGLLRTVFGDSGVAMLIWYATVLTISAAAGAIVSGLLPIAGVWYMQGAAAAAPLLFVLLSFGLGWTIEEAVQGKKDPAAGIRTMTRAIAMPSVIVFTLGAALSFVPGLSSGAGILALGITVLVIGVWLFRMGMTSGQSFICRYGLTVLGGFLAAGLILGADAALKAYGQGG